MSKKVKKSTPSAKQIQSPKRAKKTEKSEKLSVYANLSHRRKTKKETKAKERAEYLASLPKHPVKRFFYRLHPKRFFAYWFSKRGGLMALKIFGIAILLGALFIGSLFAYFRKDLDQIRPGEIDKRVQSNVNTYYDRNGKILWEDKGGGNYKLVVKSDEISDNVKKATVAIEDRDFFSHSGVSISGTVRAAINNFTGGEVQGGSTLTQQLVKQVFFASEASDRGFGGIPRKIKELILAIEIERMYDKDQILTLYLNESPYGGPRNGVESGAQAYFGKSAKDLNLAEASLLAAIPQNPYVYNPYNSLGHEGLIARQHHVLRAMREVGFITAEQEQEAKNVPILDSIKPQAGQFDDAKAPHFVLMVREQLKEELGAAVVGRGGLHITTTLDIRIQEKLESSMTDMFKGYLPNWAGFSNGAATVQDTQTGQIVALLGSRDFSYPGFGQDNASTAYIQPGSTIKSLVYAELFEQKQQGMPNYGSGSILVDEPIDDIYGAKLQNADRTYKGSVSIRTSLATSRNVPAVKAMYISGVEPTIKTIREMGAKSYCSVGVDTTAGLASAIGGCGVKQTDLVNAYATLARGGIYKDQSSVLEVKSSDGEVLKKWADSEGKRVIDAQSAYVVTDILSDVNASAALGMYTAKNIPGVKTATKTGTSDKGGSAKDLWMASYSPALTMSVWLGNPDTTILKNGNSSLGSPIVASVMEYAHKEVYAKEGKWKSGDWYSQPNGIQRVGGEVYPSWWNRTQGQKTETIKFDRVSKKLATDCTPAGAIIEFPVIKVTDPVTKKDSYSNVPEGYDAKEKDSIHECGVTGPAISSPSTTSSGSNWTITFTVTKNAAPLTGGSVKATVNGAAKTPSCNGSANALSCTIEYTGGDPTGLVSITATDSYFYTSSR